MASDEPDPEVVRALLERLADLVACGESLTYTAPTGRGVDIPRDIRRCEMTTATAVPTQPRSRRFAKLATWWGRLPTWQRIAAIIAVIAL